jgi:hypothetical protein
VALKSRSRSAKRVLGMVLLMGVVGGGLVLLTRKRDGAPTPLLSPQIATANPAALTGRPGPNPSADPMVRTAPTSPSMPPPVSPPTNFAPAPADPVQATPERSPLPGVDPPATPQPTQSPEQAAEVLALTQQAERAQADGRLVEARAALNKVLSSPAATARDREAVRAWMARLNQDLVFSPRVFPGDPLSETYSVVSGDSLVVITRKRGTVTEPALIGRINRLSNPNALRVGQSLKLLRGPFHAVVSKSAFRMDVYAGPTPSPTSLNDAGLPEGKEPGWTYIASFPVGLGEKSSTPIAGFIVRPNKLINPTWVNPRTGERYGADDPANPIGERWIGLEGHDEGSRTFQGYGIHGTIEPESIGSERSMGCVRMKSEDVEVVYELLMPRVSVVKIVP